MNSLHVATISSEMVPLAKTGGLGDVCGALPVALEQLGCRCTAFLPAYRSVLKSSLPIEPTPYTFTISIGGKHVACRLLKTRLPESGVDVYLIDQPQYFDRDGLYSDAQGEYRDNCERFSFFARSVVQAITQLKLDIDIAHCHDWQTGLIPAYMHSNTDPSSWMHNAVSLMTIHNLAYQGRFWHYDMPLTGLDWRYFNWQQMEFHGDLNFLKTGIVFAGSVTTVSPTYAREITQPALGCGLDSTLASRGSQLVGIVNGVDYGHWNPQIDPHLPCGYGVDDWQTGKTTCKKLLQEELGLEVDTRLPLIGIVSRMADQKGWDLMIPLLHRWLTATAERPSVQWAILGTGDPRYENELRTLSRQFPSRLAVRLEFSERMAHLIEAASDMFLMPSRYEPCGLNQLYSLKYGSVPIVHATGGLADTVIDASEKNLADGRATGYAFVGYALDRLEPTVVRAVDTYLHNPSRWAQIVETGMRQDWSWQHSAEHYMQVYHDTRATAGH